MLYVGDLSRRHTFAYHGKDAITTYHLSLTYFTCLPVFIVDLRKRALKDSDSRLMCIYNRIATALGSVAEEGIIIVFSWGIAFCLSFRLLESKGCYCFHLLA